MVTSELATDLARLVVILAAGVAAVPLVRRSADRRSTCLAIVFGIILALVPNVLNMVQAAGHWSLRPPLSLLSRLDAPGFALILFGVMLGLRSISRASEQLQDQNSVLKREAATDSLTGLLNRRQADCLLDYGAARARRSGEPLGFIMVDLDHFKEVNDRLGHQAGDAVLVHVAQLFKSRLRASDIVCRYGGEEFLLVLADSNSEGVFTAANDLRRLVEQNPATFGGRPIPVTASFGLAVGLVNTEDAVQECIGKADAALYAAKALGRNQVVSWEQSFREADASAREELLQRARGFRRPALRSA